MTFECDVCHKMYKNPKSFEKHRASHFAHLPQDGIIALLLKKIERLENQVKENTAYIQRQRQKINIIEYLNNQNHTTTPNFKTFIQSIRVTALDLKKYLAAEPIKGLCTLVMASLPQSPTAPPPISSSSSSPLPIRCFTGKRNVLFIKEDDMWYEMTDTHELEILINKIQCKLLVLYEEHNKKREESGQDIYRHYFEDKQKILLNTFHGDFVNKRVQRCIWDNLKEELIARTVN